MHIFRTADEPTNANLRWLEMLGKVGADLSVDQFMDRIRGVIEVEAMLPKAVRAHFQFPFLFIGSAAYSWSSQLLAQRAEEFSSSIAAGLDKVMGDVRLAKDGGADLSDRPPTKGEEIDAATSAFQSNRGQAQLAALRTAVQGTRLMGRFERLETWLRRKRPSVPHRSVEYEIVSAIADIRRYADDCHHLPASQAYRDSIGRTR